LTRIGKAEELIRSYGFRNVRVRHHNSIARIEVDRTGIKRLLKREICDRIIKRLKKMGFRYIVLDLEGYRTGSMNRMI
jgi:uncharacterized protein